MIPSQVLVLLELSSNLLVSRQNLFFALARGSSHRPVERLLYRILICSIYSVVARALPLR